LEEFCGENKQLLTELRSMDLAFIANIAVLILLRIPINS
jgi:hypothetical protein